MSRFYLFSFLMHTALFSTIGVTTKSSFKKMPEVEVYKVKLAPLPQPKVLGRKMIQADSKLKNNSKKREEKSPPEQKNVKAKNNGQKSQQNKVSKKRKGLPDGLPDIRPEIYTGSGRGFNYSYYLNILLNKISQNWNNPYKNRDVILKNIVYFEVDKNGLISNIRIENDSGDEIYNESTIRAVALTKKLPPLPQEFSDDYLKVHLEFLTAR